MRDDQISSLIVMVVVLGGLLGFWRYLEWRWPMDTTKRSGSGVSAAASGGARDPQPEGSADATSQPGVWETLKRLATGRPCP